jgi:hypothetical protein
MRTCSVQIAIIVIAAVVVCPATKTAQPLRHSAQKTKTAVSSKASTGKTSGAGASNRFALLLLQGGTIGPITSYVIAGGGGTSAAGSYSIAGTIGQASAGPPAMTGSNFSVTSGFWAPDITNTSANKRRGQITSQD